MKTKNKHNIITIHGMKRSGKDFLASQLKESLEKDGFEVRIISFADPLKKLVSEGFGISVQELDDMKNNDKQIILEQPVGIKRISSMRNYLQYFGTEVMYGMFGEDVWSKITMKNINDYLESGVDYIIVPDFRFRHEEIKKSLQIMVRNDELINNDSHISENDLVDHEFDMIVDNTNHPNHDYNIEVIKHKIGL